MRFHVLEPPRTYVNEKTLHRVCHAGETVHGRTLRKDEVAIHVTALLRALMSILWIRGVLQHGGGCTARYRIRRKQKSTE